MRRNSTEKWAEVMVEVAFIGLGFLGLFLGWPLWLCAALLFIGGVIIVVNHGDGDFSSLWD